MAITLDKTKYIMVFSINKNEEIIQFNRECEKITGYSRDEALGKNIFNFLIPKDESVKWYKILDSIRKNNFVDNIILSFLTKNGSKISVSCSTFPVDPSKMENLEICFVGETVHQDYPTHSSSIENLKDLNPSSSGFDDKNLVEIFTDNAKVSQEKEKEKKTSLDKVRSSAKEEIKNLFSRWLYLFFDAVGANKKKEELQAIARELDERRVLLNALEAELLEEKKELNKRRHEFSKWRDKLEFLEKEIEDRWVELENQEKLFRDYLASKSMKGSRLRYIKGDLGLSNVCGDTGRYESRRLVLDKIPDCAAVVYRGILMDVNSSFVELLGYEMDEVLGKSLFDFVAPESLEEVKRYYLHRLKGKEVSSFETFILGKDNRKINVEINIKPSSYGGEKTNIVVIKNLMNKEF
ncbi:MAG: PAS domain S-box protein [Candidatus Thermoplasmatota archaeon]|jgi:PAS domain S-box-containing protein|nr:PAS domain S-box protein [Candidatus Thermoplasmatota archaeon]